MFVSILTNVRVDHSFQLLSFFRFSFTYVQAIRQMRDSLLPILSFPLLSFTILSIPFFRDDYVIVTEISVVAVLAPPLPLLPSSSIVM
jgi:hypothetical protein